MNKTLAEIARWLGAEVAPAYADRIVTGASIDTRSLRPGDLFVPFRGERANGHRFVERAFERGAAASLWVAGEPDAPEDRPLLIVADAKEALQAMAAAYRAELDTRLIAITGSNGKTSTKDLVFSVLSPHFQTVKTEGNFNNELGLPLTILSIPAGAEFAVVEMGMDRFEEISYLSRLAKPEIAAIANIGEAHMQNLGSREGIARAKFEIVDGLLEGGKLLYDGDEPLLRPLVEQLPARARVSLGCGESCDLRLASFTPTAEGSTFCTAGLVEAEFTLPVLGRHQAKNALIAIAVGARAGLSAEQIREALSAAKMTSMRMQMTPPTRPGGLAFLNDAYNAAPASVKAALTAAEELRFAGDKWLVLGDMLELGEREIAYHEEIASAIDPSAWRGVVLVGRLMACAAPLLAPPLREGRAFLAQTAEEAAAILRAKARPGSLVLLKGSRGMALERVQALLDE